MTRRRSRTLFAISLLLLLFGAAGNPLFSLIVLVSVVNIFLSLLNLFSR